MSELQCHANTFENVIKFQFITILITPTLYKEYVVLISHATFFATDFTKSW